MSFGAESSRTLQATLPTQSTDYYDLNCEATISTASFLFFLLDFGQSALKVVLASFSELPMARTDVVGVPVWACRTLSGGARPQIAGFYLPPDAPKLAQASKMVVLTHLSDDRS